MQRFARSALRAFSTSPVASSSSPAAPWFVDSSFAERAAPPHMPPKPDTQHAPLPDGVPRTLAHLHAALADSPHLEPGTLLVRPPPENPPGPPLPYSPPKGRRMRGGTEFGRGVDGAVESGGIWSWIVLAQVKEGTEKRGAIESVVRVVRKSLLTSNPPLPLPPNAKKRVGDSWAMIDAGEFAVHILGRDARLKYFEERKKW